VKIREALASYHRAEDLINLGAYTAGTNAVLDAAIRVRPQLLSFLKQESATNSPMPETLESMKLLATALK
jgi:flagellum-specific ATP synthase